MNIKMAALGWNVPSDTTLANAIEYTIRRIKCVLPFLLV